MPFRAFMYERHSCTTQRQTYHGDGGWVSRQALYLNILRTFLRDIAVHEIGTEFPLRPDCPRRSSRERSNCRSSRRSNDRSGDRSDGIVRHSRNSSRGGGLARLARSNAHARVYTRVGESRIPPVRIVNTDGAIAETRSSRESKRISWMLRTSLIVVQDSFVVGTGSNKYVDVHEAIYTSECLNVRNRREVQNNRFYVFI